MEQRRAGLLGDYGTNSTLKEPPWNWGLSTRPTSDLSTLIKKAVPAATAARNRMMKSILLRIAFLLSPQTGGLSVLDMRIDADRNRNVAPAVTDCVTAKFAFI